MIRFVIISAAVAAMALAQPPSHGALTWKVLGDTTGAPRGCGAAAAIAAIDGFVLGMQRADSSALERVTAHHDHGGFEFSTGKFTTTDTFVNARSVRELVRYARLRARQHERIVIQQVQFNGWRDRGLEFGPIYFSRSADDLGTAPRPGIGKGEYWCGEGVSALNTAPRPSSDRGPRD